MPTIAYFYGIAIRMFSSITRRRISLLPIVDMKRTSRLRPGEVIEGHLPANAARLVKQWALAHRGELKDNWRRARAGTSLVGSQASTMIKVVKIKWLGGHRVRATFSDGMAGEYDFSAIVGGSARWSSRCAIPHFSRAYFSKTAHRLGRTVSMPRPVGCAAKSRRPARWRGMLRLSGQNS